MERWTHVALNYLEFDKAMFAKTMGNGKNWWCRKQSWFTQSEPSI